MRIRIRKNVILSAISVLFFISSCAMPTITRAAQTGEPAEEIIYRESSLTLAWNSDVTDSEKTYNIYYKSHGNEYWSLLDRTIDSTAEFTIDYTQLGKGSWDLGVSVVDVNGEESEIHSSLDPTAEPETGWYVTWTIG